MPIVTFSEFKKSLPDDSDSSGARSASHPQTKPMPNPWASSSHQVASSQNADYDPESQQNRTQLPSALSPFVNPPPLDDHSFWSANLPPDEPITLRHAVLACVAPCFLGPPCSKQRKNDYLHLLISFSLWISFIQFIFLIVSIAIGGVTSVSENWTLGPPTKTLYDMGAKSAFLIKNGHVYRFFTPILLHGGIFHFLFNIAAQLILVMSWERHWTIFRVFPLYWISGFAGNLLSCVLLPSNVSVGASGALLGVIGGKLGRTISLWNKLPLQLKIGNLVFVFIVVVCTFLFTFSRNVDWAAHLGGLFVGFFFSLCLWVNHIKTKWLRVLLVGIGSSVTIVYFVTLLLVFYLVVPVQREV
mmetsp:Transcript_10906/g.40665  ORF Transcript_10906/g.40665 Transcript_10906/m.40665 type:complete len:358 (-) Transcript_10906:2353-3426(-)